MSGLVLGLPYYYLGSWEWNISGSSCHSLLLSSNFLQYLSLPHLFLPDSGSPVGFLLDSYWISTKFLKRHFHIFFHFPSYWTPTGLLLDSYWTPMGLQVDSNWTYTKWMQWIPTGFLLDSYWTPHHFVQLNHFLSIFHLVRPHATWEFHSKVIFEYRWYCINDYLHN